jgi:hypothetical protein
MVDVGLAQVIVRQLNRWQRKRANPHGTTDHFHRGTRMSFTAASRIVPTIFSVFLLALACVLYFGPNFMADKPPLEVLALKIGWLAIVAVALLAPLQAFREYVIITNGGLLKSNLFGRQTRIVWNDIVTFRINPDDNKVVFLGNAKTKFTMSLAYDGWQDFLKIASRRMNQPLYLQFQLMFTNIDIKRPVLRSTKTARRAK